MVHCLQSLANLGSSINSMQDTVDKVEPFIKATNTKLEDLTTQIQDINVSKQTDLKVFILQLKGMKNLQWNDKQNWRNIGCSLLLFAFQNVCWCVGVHACVCRALH